MRKTLHALKREGAAFLAGLSDSAALDAAALLQHACGLTTAELLARLNDPCPADAQAAYMELLEKRLTGAPVAYLTGAREFMSLPFSVTPDILIPRPDTELLVETVLARYANKSARGLEIGVGSGCISVSLAVHGGMAMTGVDISPAALAVALYNTRRNGADGNVTLRHGDMFAALDESDAHSFDFLVSNPPYIPAGDIAGLDATVRDFEPRLALDGGATGLDFYERLARDGAEWLLPGGMIFLEIGYDQREAVMSLLAENGWTDIAAARDLAGRDRVISAICTRRGETEINTDDIKKTLRQMLDATRMAHTLAVCDTAVMLAERFGADPKKAHLAALLHDCARGLDGEQLVSYCDENGIVLDKYMKEEVNPIHALVGADMAKKRFGIHDESILSAIKNHAIGCKNMPLLDKIILVADAIEPSRPGDDADEARTAAEHDIDAAIVPAMRIKSYHLQGKPMHPDSIRMLEELSRAK